MPYQDTASGADATEPVATLAHFRALRQRHGLSQRKVSTALGLSTAYVSRLECGDFSWRPVYWFALCGLTGHDATQAPDGGE